MRFYTLEEVSHMHIGEIATPARDAFEKEVEAAMIGANKRTA